MDNFNLNLSITLLSILGIIILAGFILLLKYMLTPKYDARKANMTNKAACRTARR